MFCLPSDTRPETRLTCPKNRSARVFGSSAARRWGKCSGETTDVPSPVLENPP